MVEREDLIRAMVRLAGRGIEIGPSYSPIVRKADGHDVKVIDHCSTEDLRAKYRDEPNVDTSRIEDVDFIWDGRPLTDLVGETGTFDYVIASHVIEHTPDMLGFLKQCSALLKPDGVLALAVPDKRKCFDALRPWTTTGQVLQAHHERRTVHSPGIAFDHVAWFCTRHGASGWSDGDTAEVALSNGLAFAKAVFERSARETAYYDFHAWTFTPSTFRLIVSDLARIGALDLREVTFRPMPGIEFLISLSKGGHGPDAAHADLLNAAQREVRAPVTVLN